MRRVRATATTRVIWAGAMALFALGAGRDAAAEPSGGAPLGERSRESRLVAWVEIGPDGLAIARAITCAERPG